MIVAVAHNKGGVGKTTTVVQLAGELKPEIIIDLDAHQGIAIINGRRPGVDQAVVSPAAISITAMAPWRSRPNCSGLDEAA